MVDFEEESRDDEGGELGFESLEGSEFEPPPTIPNLERRVTS